MFFVTFFFDDMMEGSKDKVIFLQVFRLASSSHQLSKRALFPDFEPIIAPSSSEKASLLLHIFYQIWNLTLCKKNSTLNLFFLPIEKSFLARKVNYLKIYQTWLKTYLARKFKCLKTGRTKLKKYNFDHFWRENSNETKMRRKKLRNAILDIFGAKIQMFEN